jgi:hypothetical protein
MTEAAELVTRHLVLARLGKARPHLGNKAGHHHRVDIGVGEQEAMHDIGAGQPELHRRICRHADAMRHEIILLANEPDCGGAVWLDGRAEIALHELAAEMERQRLDDLDIARRVQRAGDAGYDEDHHHDGEHHRHDHEPAALGAGDDRFRDDAVRERLLQWIDCGSANGPSRQKEEEIERQPADEQQRHGDAGDDERANRSVLERLGRLVRSDG